MAGSHWRGRRVLVTGAGGFIGSHLAERLVELGAETRALVRYNSRGSAGWLDTSPVREDIEVHLGDVRDRGSVRAAMQGRDTVFHLAALIGIPYSYEAPESYVDTNVTGTLNVLEVARDLETARVVHTSTSEVYGSARYVPIDTAHPLQGQSPYSASKIGADKMAESYHRSFGVPVVTVRPFNTYGPRQSARAVIPAIAIQGLAGGTIRLGNLHPTRDLNYVADTVEGFLACGDSERAVGEVLNLGTGREISIGDLARLVLETCGASSEIEVEEQRLRPDASEVDRLLADASRTTELVGWEPRITLEEGIRRTVEWLRENTALYRAREYAV